MTIRKDAGMQFPQGGLLGSEFADVSLCLSERWRDGSRWSSWPGCVSFSGSSRPVSS